MPRESEIDRDILWNALYSLPEPQLEAVAWRDILGHPYERVATEMGIPIEQARTHVIQGRIALRNTIFSI